MNPILLATHNVGKLQEFQQLLADLSLPIVPQTDWNVPDVEETGLTFVENALIKARHAAQITGFSAIADDSGIEVDALQGAPGIYSARYGGKETSSRIKNQMLLEALKDVPSPLRTARFQCVLVFLTHANDPTPLICQGTWEGHILVQPQGEGFGYDPVFYVASHGCSAAELPYGEKNRLSHRGQALQQLLKRMPAKLATLSTPVLAA